MELNISLIKNILHTVSKHNGIQTTRYTPRWLYGSLCKCELCSEYKKEHKGNQRVKKCYRNRDKARLYYYYIKILLHHGLLLGKEKRWFGREYIVVEGLTLDGHDFLKVLNNKNIWNKLMLASKELAWSSLKAMVHEVAVNKLLAPVL